MALSNFLLAVILSLVAGLSTGIGSLISFLVKKPKKSHLCFSLGFSAGVMIYISFAELLASSIAENGFGPANIAFFAGIIFIMIVDFFIPHDYILEHVKCKSNCKNPKLMMA